MSHPPEHIVGVTTHSRHGAIRHGFRYVVDFVLIDPDDNQKSTLFSRNRFNLASVYDRDHGGALKKGRGGDWARNVFDTHGLAGKYARLQLLTQPRFFGQVFNPVSFWFALSGEDLIAVIAEVTTPFGDRHSYLCRHQDFTTITKDCQIKTPKSLHVSPFQEIKGTYEFGFDIDAAQVSIRILHRNGNEGMVATLSGARMPMTNAGLLRASLRRPFGGLRTKGLIYWQALRLKLKGAKYRNRPLPPQNEVT